MGLFSALGRFLFVSLFIVSGIVKVQNFDMNTGGAIEFDHAVFTSVVEFVNMRC